MESEKTGIDQGLYLGFISTIVPRRCGIATYNRDQVNNTVKDPRVADWGLFSIVINKNKKFNGLSLPYAPYERRHIQYEIDQYNPEDFDRAGDKAVEVTKYMKQFGIFSGIFLQHEFGLYGKDHKKDDSIVKLLKKFYENNIATVTTLHTVETEPKEDKREEKHKNDVMRGIFKFTDKAISISPSGISKLMEKYDAPRGKLIHIPHGVPEKIITESRDELKSKYDFAGRPVFTSLGHISAGKGLKYGIDGFAEVLEGKYKHKNPVYLIAGTTHEEVSKKEGEGYWESCVQRARERKISGAIINEQGKITNLYRESIDNLKGVNIVFLHRALKDEEIPEIMQMSDAGVVINLSKEQYASGPGSQWTGRSRITIGTESVFFKDLERQGVGLLVPFRDSSAIADRMNHILGLKKEDFNNLEYLASDIGSTRTWSIVATAKLNLMEKLIMHRIA